MNRIPFVSPSPASLRFGGEKEYHAYLTRLRGYNETTIARIAGVQRNEKSQGARHIALAVAYGLRDKSVRELNNLIIDLINRRDQNKGKNDDASGEAVEHLHDLRRAITTVLGEHGYDADGKKLNTKA